MKPGQKNSYNSLKSITINGKDYKYYSLSEAEKNGLDGISKLPKSLKVLLENLLRYEDDLTVTKNQIEAIKNWLQKKKIFYRNSLSSSKSFTTRLYRYSCCGRPCSNERGC